MERLIHDSTSRPARPRRSGTTPDAETEQAAPDLHHTLSEVTHDINNPLAIISGNAQLLLELSRLLNLDPDVARPIQDIEEASRRLAAIIGRLSALGETMPEGMTSGDGL